MMQYYRLSCSDVNIAATLATLRLRKFISNAGYRPAYAPEYAPEYTFLFGKEW